MINDLSTLIGVNGLPLSYVVWEKDNPNKNGDLPNFIDKTIECLPIKSNYYKANCHTVHQVLVSLETRHPLEYWIKATLRYRDGMRSMKELGIHFTGEGNSNRKVSEAERLCNSINL